MNVAHKIKQLNGFRGEAWLFRMDPPYDGHEYVVVSAVRLKFRRSFDDPPDEETYIFPATPDGAVSDWGELPGSFKGAMDITQALHNAGYKVEESV